MKNSIFNSAMNSGGISLSISGLIAIAILFSGISADADRIGKDGKSFLALVHEIQNSDDITFIALGEADAKTQARFEFITNSQFQIWGDTILEGGYAADSDSRIDRIEGVYRGEKLLAYRLTYSSHGWETFDCSYDATTNASFAGCVEGRIQESTYVSTSLDSWTRDNEAFAEFTTQP